MLGTEIIVIDICKGAGYGLYKNKIYEGVDIPAPARKYKL